MTCKDCYHCNACCGHDEEAANREYPPAEKCIDFKDKSQIVELPCKVGDTVYYIKGGYCRKAKFCTVSRPCKVVEVSFKLDRKGEKVMEGFITDNGTRYSFKGIGKTVFLTREEAEAALRKE